MARNLPTPFRFIEDPSWAPFGLLQREMSRLFDDASRNGEGQGARSGLIAPRLDVRETDKEFRVSVELPGVAEEDIEVDVDPSVDRDEPALREHPSRRPGRLTDRLARSAAPRPLRAFFPGR